MAISMISARTWRTGSSLDILIRATPVSMTLLRFKSASDTSNHQLSLDSSTGVQSTCSNLAHSKHVMHGNVEHHWGGHLLNRTSWSQHVKLPKKLVMNRSLFPHSCMILTFEQHQAHECKRPLHLCKHYQSSALMLAGHNRWSKVKHKKKTTDLEKSKNIHKYMTLIVSAIKTGGGADPDNNVRLASVMEAARKAGIDNNLLCIPLQYHVIIC